MPKLAGVDTSLFDDLLAAPGLRRAGIKLVLIDLTRRSRRSIRFPDIIPI